MAIPDPPKAGSPFSPLQTGGCNPKTPEINNFFIVRKGAFPCERWAESCLPGLEASSKPAQYPDARVEMRERVLKVMTSIAEHMSKIECPEGLHIR